MDNCNISEVQVQEAFLAAPPFIAEQILDLSVKHPNWLRDIAPMNPWVNGNGTIMTQLIFRGAMPPIERGFDKWSKQENNTGCDPCAGPNCSYNWTPFGGNGFERKNTQLMSREFRSPSYCVKNIQTTAHFKEVMAKVIENLFRQTDFFKEINLMQNALTSLAKKYVVDSGGAKPNTQNPYVYRPIGAKRISTLNIDMLEYFYEWMRRIPSCVPYDVADGSPIFALESSHQLLARLERDNYNLRTDVRFSEHATEMLTKYNFLSTVRGMFIRCPILFPRRFNYVEDSGIGHWEEVLPYVNDVPMEVGAYTDINPLYEMATHEEVTLHGMYPFSWFYQETEKSVGDKTDFGPEDSFMNNWMWVNPQTSEDPFRRVGYFATSASVGLSAQFSEGIFSILVERPKVGLMATWLPEPSCPPEEASCDNEVPPLACPCALILDAFYNNVTGYWQLHFSSSQDVIAEDTVQLGLDTGGYITGTVTDVSADGYYVEFDFGSLEIPTCDHFVSIYCDDTLGCASDVLSYRADPTDTTRIYVTLKHALKADTAADVITVKYGDGTSESYTVISVDMINKVWRIDRTAGNFDDSHGGVVSICVPNTTDASCPACGGPTASQCEYEES